jgi:NTE family protein
MFSPKAGDLFGWTLGKSAQPESGTPIRKSKCRKLRIGVALGAGAARGWSHIGVLQELAANRIHPDIIAGTSIGAIVGAYFAAGRLSSLTQFASTLTKRRVFGLMDLSLSGLGIFAGAKLKKSLEDDLSDLAIETLPKTFSAVATEVATGHEVWLRRGSLVDAVRASYALPGILEPVQIDGRWLFDGALVNPVPVTVCRALGADMVIAVNIIGDNAFRGTVMRDGLPRASALELLEKGPKPHVASPWAGSGVPGIANAVMDAFNIAQDRISRSRLAGDPPDILINARNSHIGLFDFHRADELIAIGRDAARRALDDIAEHIVLAPCPAADGDAS